MYLIDNVFFSVAEVWMQPMPEEVQGSKLSQDSYEVSYRYNYIKYTQT